MDKRDGVGIEGSHGYKDLIFQTREFCLCLYANSKGEDKDEGKS